MKRVLEQNTGFRARAVTVGALLVVLVYLLVMSSRTGQRDFELAKYWIDEVQVANVQVDSAIFLLSFELQMDFDQVTEQARAMRLAAERVAEQVDGGEAVLAPVMRKLEIVEEFKSLHAVLRNSRAIAQQMVAALWQSELTGDLQATEQLFAVERALLEYFGRRDAVSGEALLATLDDTAQSGLPMAATPEWASLDAHARNFLDYNDRLARLYEDPVYLELPEQLYEQGLAIAERLVDVQEQGFRYRIALFVVALLLLAFSAAMVARVRRYFVMLARANDELEARVELRTEELATANEALKAEMAERENVESQLRIAQKLESIGQLAAGIAHEINTPVQYVSDNVSFLEGMWRDLEPVLDDYEQIVQGHEIDRERSRALLEQADVGFLREEVPSALEHSALGLRQIGHIVQAMKNFSHPGSEGFHPTDLNAAIENTVTVARNEWKYIAEVSLDLDEALPAVVCNLSAFNQVVLNLLVNAAHAIDDTRDGDGFGRIGISSRRVGNRVEIAVEDDGPGVPVDLRDRVFDPFFTTKKVGKGTGQGLSIAHRIVEQHHGTLTVEQSGWGGARFVIRLPLPEETFEKGGADAERSAAGAAA